MRHFIDVLFRRFSKPAETLDGYEHPELIDLVFRKTQAFVPTKPWPEMAGASSVLDFGGACGLHYKVASVQSPNIRWAVVDTPAMVKRASELSTDRLQFFSEIKAAADWLGPIDVMHSNGALQYVDDPISTLSELCALRAGKMIWERMRFSSGGLMRETQISRLVDNGPGRSPRGTEDKLLACSQTLMPEMDFLSIHTQSGYRLRERGSDWFRFDRAPCDI